MNILEFDVLRAVGWGLLHFLWQGTVLVLVSMVLLGSLVRAPASWRYVVAFGILALAPLLLLGTIISQLPVAPVAATITAATPGVVEPFLPIGSADISLPSVASRFMLGAGQLPAILALCWLVVVGFLWTRLALMWRGAARMARALSSHLSSGASIPFAERALARARTRMRVTRLVRLTCVETGNTPAVLGWMRATILLPVSVASSLTIEQVEMLLAHELAHVRRHDYSLNILQCWVETLLFFHPGIWWLSRRVRAERELACDEAVVLAYGQPEEYGEALASLALLDATPPAHAMAATSSPLVFRIRRLMDGKVNHELLAARWLVALAAPAALIATVAGGQLAAAQSSLRGMLDARVEGGSVVERHEHANRHWARTASIHSRSASGEPVIDLRLGRSSNGLRFVALLSPRVGADTAIVSLRVEEYGRLGRRTRELLLGRNPSMPQGDADSLVRIFLRESGVNGHSRAVTITRALGARGVLQESDAIGDPVVALTYLEAGMTAGVSAGERDALVVAALRVHTSPVDVARVVRAAMRTADSQAELVHLVDRIPGVSGEAERLALLLDAIRLAERTTPALRNAVERVALSLPGEDARDAVRRALARQ